MDLIMISLMRSAIFRIYRKPVQLDTVYFCSLYDLTVASIRVRQAGLVLPVLVYVIVNVAVKRSLSAYSLLFSVIYLSSLHIS